MTQITKIRSESENSTATSTEVERIIREYYKQLYTGKLDKLNKMEKFLGK